MAARRVLVASQAPPLFDRDSGSRRVLDLLELLVEDDWYVTFVSANGRRQPRYEEALLRRGIYVVDGMTGPVEDIVVTAGFDLALLVSWPVAELYLPLLRSLSPDTRVVVDSLDLQFLRDARRLFQNVSRRGLLDEEFGRQLVAEINTYASADAVLTVSEKEAAIVADTTGMTTAAHVVPDIEEVPDDVVGPADRQGLLFVGSFRHTPNVHAVEYLCREIVPRLGADVLERHPVYIVGDALNESVRRFADGLSGVRMVGWVPAVLPYLRRARVSLVPLQYGAGTKRKMIQTLMAGTPCVSTTVGIEGLPLESGRHVLVADEPDEFAAAVKRLLVDDELWGRLARAGSEPVVDDHGRSAVAARFRSVLDDVMRSPAKEPMLPDADRATYDARLVYQDNQRTAAHLREILADLVPPDATVLVASGGSEEMLRLGGFAGWHFPRHDDGSLGPNPGNAPALVATVGHLQRQGATHFLLPARAHWWFDFYPDFEAFLRTHHRVVAEHDDWGWLFALSGAERRTGGRVPVVSATQPAEIAKLIAFYLPQYHPIPENDAWWGPGFTEWNNVVTRSPLFAGHDQPRIPGELGFYDLRLPETRRAQAELASEYGIHAFCYYHYWFGGRRLLERPFEEVLATGEPELPFCLCWANEPWSRRWNGRNEDVLQEQTYSPDDDVAHVRALLRAFADPRYLRVEDKPLFLVYQARDLPDPRATVDRWRTEADRAGLPGLYLMTVETGWDAGWDAGEVGFDAKVLFQPQFSLLAKTPRREIGGVETLEVHDYADAWPRLANPPEVPYLRYESVFPMWDNSARRGPEAVVVHDSSPEQFEAWLGVAIERAVQRDAPEPFVFVNAWNEWAEGCHLEPDARHGRAYLEATRRALDAARVHRAVAPPSGANGAGANGARKR
jgi:glycosyltransferase involved in cell wall biosynthesis